MAWQRMIPSCNEIKIIKHVLELCTTICHKLEWVWVVP